jgi:glutamyl endopeptidase
MTLTNWRPSRFSLIGSLIVSSFAWPVQAFQGTDPMQLPMSNIGPIRGTESASESASPGGMPFAGSGTLDSESAKSALAWPSNDGIRGLPPVVGGNGIESVLGTDTRLRTYTTTYPARATALITFDGGYCTGWFYGPNVVATAGHCVHSGGTGGSWRTNVRVYPGYDAGLAPYGSYPAAWTASVVGWTVSGDERYDYGVVKLRTSIGNTVGWFGWFWQTASLTGLPSIVEGYPGDKVPAKSQWATADIIRVTQERQVFYKDDTFGGQSGSAVWQDRPAGSSFCANGPCAYAIHAYGLHGAAPHSDHNHATRITSAVSTNLTNWRNAAP